MNDISDIPDDWEIAGHDELAGMPTKDKGLIITGLGGDGKLLRYFVVIPANKHLILESSSKTKVNTTVKSLFAQTEAKVEKNHNQSRSHPPYVINQYRSPCRRNSNAFHPKNEFDSDGFLEHYLVVNTQIPSEYDIRKYVKETKKS